MSVLEDVAQNASPYPTVDLAEPHVPHSGALLDTPKFCRKVFSAGACSAFYDSIKGRSGRFQCPYGFSVWPMQLGALELAVTAVVATPRFGGAQETRRAKEYATHRVAAAHVEQWAQRTSKLVDEGEVARAAEFARRLEALHEIR